MFMNQGGGGGGGRGGGNPFGGMGGGMDDFGGGGFGGMPGAGGGRSRQPEPKPKPEDINRPLPVALEDLFNGATKKLKITRRLLSGEEQEKIVTVQVKPGWKAGTKVRFDGLGTEIRGGPSADVVCAYRCASVPPQYGSLGC
jgi:DnaJ family protein B protein 4